MNISIRESIKENFKDSSEDDIKEAIESSKSDQEELTLPGLGVFFEILWNNSSLDEQRKIVDTIKKNI